MRFLLLLLLALPGIAWGDAEEIGRRVKAVGIDEALSARILGAIERGCTWLRGRQSMDGSFDPRSSRGGTSGDATWIAGATALSALVLRHAGKPASRNGGATAVQWLAGDGRTAALSNTYAGGFTAMLLRNLKQEHGPEADLLRDIGSSLVTAFRPGTGAWDYGTFAGRGGVPSNPNLSTSQVGALGLWAAARAGLEVPRRVWRRHLDALLDAQQPDGSWPYAGRAAPGPLSSYPTGAYMGLADVVLAKDALRSDLASDERLRERVEIAILRGRWAVRRMVRWTLAGLGSVSAYPHYELFALEKACVFAGADRLGTVAWYREGALRLLATQEPTGGWYAPVEGETVATAFALLFLLRTIETITPRDPSDSTPAWTGPAIPVALARERVASLAAHVADLSVPHATLLTDLDRIEDALVRVDPRAPAPEQAAFTAEAEAALLSALRLVRIESRANVFALVNVRAARVLAALGPRAAVPMQEFLGKEALPERRFDVGVELLEAGFDLLAGSGIAPPFDASAALPTAAALVAMQGLASAPREARLAAARALVERLASLAPASPLHPDLVIALRDLLREGHDEAVGEGGKPISSVPEAADWLRRRSGG